MTKEDLKLELYKLAHQHLFQTDKNRDQLLVFYTTIVGAYVAFLGLGAGAGEGNSLSSGEFVATTGIPIAVALLSLVVGWQLILYRRWHTYYVEMIKLFSRLTLDDKTRNGLLSSWEELQKGKPVLPSNYSFSVEGMFFNGFLVISFPTIFVVIRPFICIRDTNEVVMYIVLNLIYIFVGNYISNSVRNLRFKDSWMLETLASKKSS
jgi:hypothetical protein